MEGGGWREDGVVGYRKKIDDHFDGLGRCRRDGVEVVLKGGQVGPAY